MAPKTKPTNLIDTVSEIYTIAQSKGVIRLFTQDRAFNGRKITIKDQKLLNFGSCSYLGLELDHRLKEAGIDAIRRYGSQFSCSRTYVSFTLYEELEELIGKMFQSQCLLSTCSTLGHDAVIPIVIGDNDAVILDQQAHISMQEVSKKLQVKGIPLYMLRHNRMDELEKKIVELSSKHEKVWYFCDGIYSMYGDLAPTDNIEKLLHDHPKLWLYCDDAHGMSWAGLHGTGFIKNKLGLHPKMILATSLAKGFASAGGVFVFPNETLYNQVKNWYSPLTYSGPQQPAVIGASVASAKIHLSGEIYERQQALRERIVWCNELLKSHNLPLVAESESPIFFIGLGLTRVGYNMVQRMVNDGFYVNLGIFPAVPETCTGIRFTITLNHTFEDIERLCERLAFHLPKALREEGRTMDDVYKAFRSLRNKKEHAEPNIAPAVTTLKLEKQTSIHDVPEVVWNRYMGDKGSFDHSGLTFLEKVYKGNKKREHNWDFRYYLIKDATEKVIAATFFTSAWCKEDMFAPASISMQIEEKRTTNPYYLSSKAYIMGSMLTEGEHLYLDRSHKQWKQALMMLLDEVWKDQEQLKSDYLYLRDFDSNDLELRDFFMDQGFIKMNLPDTHVFENFNWDGEEEYLAQLPGKKRNRIRREVLKYRNCFEVNFISNPSAAETEHWYRLYQNIRSKNLSINTFDIPKKFFKNVSGENNWDIIEIRLKPELDSREKRLPVGVGFIYRAEDSYCPIALGLDYDFISYNTYRQMLYQAIIKAGALNMKRIFFGFTASEDKQKFGITPVSKCTYVQIKDHFNMSMIHMMPNMKANNMKVKKGSNGK